MTDDEGYETVGPHSTVRPVVQQKVKREQPKAKGVILKGSPV